MATKNVSGKSGLTLKHKIGYAMGDLGGCMTFALMGSMVTRYYTNILQVDTRILAALLLIWNIWDAVNDPLMGILMDRMYAKSRNPKGKFRPWLIRIAPLLCVTFIAFWTLPTLFDGFAMLVVLFFCKILYEGCYTMFNIPMGSLLGAMANNDAERSTLSSARGFGSLVGNVLPMIILPQLLAVYGDTSFAFGAGAAICALIGFVCCLLHYFWTEERNAAATEAVSFGDGVKVSDIFVNFRKNRAYVALIIHGICICTQQYVALALCPVVSKRIGLEKMVRICLLCAAASYVGLFAFMMTAEITAVTYMVWSTIASSFTSVSIYMQWGLVATVTDYNEMVTGKRTEGTIYGTFNLARRFGQTVGNSAAVLALGWIGYEAGAAVQTAGTVTGIKALCVLIPALFVMGSWAAFKFIWNITPQIREQMAARRAAQ